MSTVNLIAKLKKAGLVGRGGACYPVWQKWQAVLDAKINDSTDQYGIDATVGKYVICNCSEGEPGVKKDAYLIEKHALRVIDGMKLALDSLGAKKGIFYLNEEYYKKYQRNLEAIIQSVDAPIELFSKPHTAGYIGGEETTLLNVIEGKHPEPRLKPPYPVTHGLWGQPTLVHNVETFYDISRIAAGDYKATRVYTLTGDCLFEGVFELPIADSIEQVLRSTHNYPKFDFFVQVGGDGSGEVLNSSQLGQLASGAGTIHVYSTLKYEPIGLIRNWVNFFMTESCGKCTPCREGTYRLSELLAEPKPDWTMVKSILDNLSETSFCALGMSVPVPIYSYTKNVLKKSGDSDVKLAPTEKKLICDCFCKYETKKAKN